MPYPTATREQIEFYREHGYLVVEGAIDPEDLTELSERCQTIIENKETMAFDWAWDKSQSKDERDFKILQSSPTVFWPEPNVESVVVRLVRHPPPVATPSEALFRVVDEGFAQRRKTMRNALVRLGLDRDVAERALSGCGLDANVRAEQLGMDQFACLAEAIGG